MQYHSWSQNQPARIRPMQVVELIRKVIPLKAWMLPNWVTRQQKMISPEELVYHFQSQYANFWAIVEKYGQRKPICVFASLRRFGAMFRKIQYLHVCKEFARKMIRISKRHYRAHSRLERFLSCAVGRSCVVKYIQLGDMTYEKHLRSSLFICLWWSKCVCVCVCQLFCGVTSMNFRSSHPNVLSSCTVPKAKQFRRLILFTLTILNACLVSDNPWMHRAWLLL